MSEFQETALQLADAQSGPDWLSEVRREGRSHWSAASWPGRRTEAWKYTPLKPLEARTPSRWASFPAAPPTTLPQQIDWSESGVVQLVFVNGVFSRELSILGDQPGVTRFSQATIEQRELIRQHLGQHVDQDRHMFAALSNAWAEEGVLVHVPRNEHLKTPVCIVHLSVPESEPGNAQQRCLVVLDSGASASVTEHYQSTDASQNGFVNALTELVVGENAQLRHCRINLEQEELLHVGGVHVDIAANGRLNAFAIAQGSPLKRIDYQVNHRGKGSELDLNGIYLPKNRQLVDYHTCVDHCEPHGTTRETFRGIVGGRAKAVFNGRIHIHPHAQKTLAELNNRNLLTSKTAEVDTKPELEIYADDVQCAHGATVSQLDTTALYYLRSRGLDEDTARVMMSFGFINEVLNEAPESAVQSFLRPRIADLLGQRLATEEVAE